MLDFESLDKVSNTLCKINSTLSIKHVIEMKNRSSNKRNARVNDFAFYYSLPYKNPKFYNMDKAPSTNSGLVFNNNGHIVIESKKTSIKNDQMVSDTIKVNVYLSDAPQLLNTLEIVINWLTSLSNEVYISDTNGSPIKISDPMLRTMCHIQSESTGLVFKPCIVTDTIDTKYQGIAMGNHEKGEICNFTATEFVVFRNVMIHVLNNLYADNMLLSMQAMQYCMYSNFMEAMRKNARTDKPK